MKSRMALVGHNCMVSRLADGVTVGSGSKNSPICAMMIWTTTTLFQV